MRSYLLAICVLMIIACVGGIVVVAMLPALVYPIPPPPPSADITALTKRVASDASYIAALESVIQTGRASIRAILVFFLAMFTIITVVLWIPSSRPRDAATRET
jgi:hypothetical protein